MRLRASPPRQPCQPASEQQPQLKSTRPLRSYPMDIEETEGAFHIHAGELARRARVVVQGLRGGALSLVTR